MRALLINSWKAVRETYWFVPSLMAIGAIVLSFATTSIDQQIGSKWLNDISWLYANKPAGARAVLSTVAGSMITVAGVTFSMTIMSISYTTSSVGARLLKNFMRDRGNQITLGVFISTFLYCLLVLRTVRNADTPPPNGGSDIELASAFVPHIAILTGILMAIASVGVLIYFIHHVPESIHISNIVAGVGRDLNTRIDDQFPTTLGEPDEDDSKRDTEAHLSSSFYDTAQKIEAKGVGYIEYVDGEGLMGVASEHDLILRLRFRPGDFVTDRSVLLLVSPADRVDDEIIAQIRAKYVWGAQRTMTQNLRYLFNQLVEVAMRALSPGINDPFTATNCMDWMQSALENLASRKMPAAHRYDSEQNLRIVAEAESFEAFLSTVFDQLRPYVSVDRNAAVHMMEMIAKIAIAARTNSQRRLLIRHAGALRRECERNLRDVRGRALLTHRYRVLMRLIQEPEYRRYVIDTGDWIGGRA